MTEVELRELRQHSRRRWQRTYRQCWRRHEGGEALVAEPVVPEVQALQCGQLAQGRCEGDEALVAKRVYTEIDPRESMQCGRCKVGARNIIPASQMPALPSERQLPNAS